VRIEDSSGMPALDHDGRGESGRGERWRTGEARTGPEKATWGEREDGKENAEAGICTSSRSGWNKSAPDERRRDLRDGAQGAGREHPFRRWQQ